MANQAVIIVTCHLLIVIDQIFYTSNSCGSSGGWMKIR